MKNKIKVLLIVGIHGNEERTKRILLDSLLVFNNKNENEDLDYDIDFFDISSGSTLRDVTFNLNRMDEVDNLIDISAKMQSLKNHIQNYDIILDLHNSEICKNILLVSSGNFQNLNKWKIDKINKKYRKMIIWRESSFISISEFARNLGKVAFTVEFNGMNTNKKFTPKKDIDFLFESIELSKNIFKNIEGTESTKGPKNPTNTTNTNLKKLNKNKNFINLFTKSNKLRDITLVSKQFLFGGKIIPGEEIEMVKGLEFPIGSETKDYFKKYRFEVVCPERNETKSFEGTMKKIKMNQNC